MQDFPVFGIVSVLHSHDRLQMFGATSDKEFSQAIDKEHAYDEKVDIWAVGVVAYELLFGQPPFFQEDEHETEQMILATRIFMHA